MRRIMLSVSFLFLLCGTSGCTLNGQFVAAVDETWSVIGPRYEAYIAADPNLSADDKKTRIRTSTMLTETIAEAKK